MIKAEQAIKICTAKAQTLALDNLNRTIPLTAKQREIRRTAANIYDKTKIIGLQDMALRARRSLRFVHEMDVSEAGDLVAFSQVRKRLGVAFEIAVKLNGPTSESARVALPCLRLYAVLHLGQKTRDDVDVTHPFAENRAAFTDQRRAKQGFERAHIAPPSTFEQGLFRRGPKSDLLFFKIKEQSCGQRLLAALKLDEPDFAILKHTNGRVRRAKVDG